MIHDGDNDINMYPLYVGWFIFQYEKQQTEKQLKRVDEEKCSINSELLQAREEVTKYQEEMGKSKGTQLDLEDRLEKLTLQIEYVSRAKEEVSNCRVSCLMIDHSIIHTTIRPSDGKIFSTLIFTIRW